MRDIVISCHTSNDVSASKPDEDDGLTETIQFRVKEAIKAEVAALAEAAGDAGPGPYCRRLVMEHLRSLKQKGKRNG